MHMLVVTIAESELISDRHQATTQTRLVPQEGHGMSSSSRPFSETPSWCKPGRGST